MTIPSNTTSNAANSAIDWTRQKAEVLTREQLNSVRDKFRHPESDSDIKLKETAEQFEAVFVKQLLDTMDKTVDRTDSLFGGGHAEETFRGMLNEEISKSVASSGGPGLGLAESVFRQMALQELTEHKGDSSSDMNTKKAQAQYGLQLPPSLPPLPSMNLPSQSGGTMP